MIGRDRPADGDSTATRLANLTARHDQAMAVIDEHLRRHKGNPALTDPLLDVRNALQPPRRT